MLSLSTVSKCYSILTECALVFHSNTANKKMNKVASAVAVMAAERQNENEFNIGKFENAKKILRARS